MNFKYLLTAAAVGALGLGAVSSVQSQQPTAPTAPLQEMSLTTTRMAQKKAAPATSTAPKPAPASIKFDAVILQNRRKRSIFNDPHPAVRNGRGRRKFKA